MRDCLKSLPSEQLFIITDTGSFEHCLPVIGEFVTDTNTIVIKNGDSNKTLDTICDIWRFLIKNRATRSSVVINLGGGMVTDMGGFAASTFKRGMKFINIPTTLLGTIDAATGGKTGFNFDGLKNEIGVINPAEKVIISPRFFKTLSREELLSGYAEMLKHALLDSKEHLDSLLSLDVSDIDEAQWLRIIERSLKVKSDIVAADPFEKGLRKALNLGHTVGHAFESLAMEREKPVPHGYCVAFGLIVALHLSYKFCGLDSKLVREMSDYIKEHYGHYDLGCDDYEPLYKLMLHDKKNVSSAEVTFTLLDKIGSPVINKPVAKDDIFKALDFYRDCAGI